MQRELCATVGKDEHTVTEEIGEDGRWRVVIDGREVVVDARQVRPGTWSLLVDGESWIVDLDERRAGTVALHGVYETPIKLEDARRKRLAEVAQRSDKKGAADGAVLAPIAGKVVKVLVEVGAAVTEGQGLIVLEAMKMENEIKAARAGTIAGVHVDPGQSVDTQEKLLSFEPE